MGKVVSDSGRQVICARSRHSTCLLRRRCDTNDQQPENSTGFPYRNRAAGGRALAGLLRHYEGQSDVVVLALPRGGVPVGYEVARVLQVPLDVFLVRKLGVPGHEELAMGAIAGYPAAKAVRVLNEDVVQTLGISGTVIERVAEQERRELERREQLYRGSRPALEVRGHTIILVDDGLATGSTMRAAARALSQEEPARLVIGVPVASAQTCEEFETEVDEIICAATPEPFRAVGLWYDDFSPTGDDEVRHLLAKAHKAREEQEA